MSTVATRRAQRPDLAHFTLIGKRCRWQEEIAEVMEAQNMAPKKVWYRFPCIILSTVPISMDSIERRLIIDYAVSHDSIDAVFWGGLAKIRLKRIFFVEDSCAAISCCPRSIVEDNQFAGGCDW